MNSQKSILLSSKRSIKFVVPGQIIQKILGFCITIILARYLVVSDFGIYNFFVGITIIFSFFSNYGVSAALQRYLPEYYRTSKFSLWNKTFLSAITFRITTFVIVGFFMLLFGEKIFNYLELKVPFNYFWIYYIGLFALFNIEYLTILFNSCFSHNLSIIVLNIYTSLRLMLIVYAFINNYELYYIFLSDAVGYLLGASVLWVLYFKKSHHLNNLDSNNSIELKRFLRFTAFNAGVIPGNILFSYALDYFMVSLFLDTTSLGYYAFASRVNDMLLSIMPHKILQSIIRPAFLQKYSDAKDPRLELRYLFTTLIIFFALILFPIVFIRLASSKFFLIYFFNEKYLNSYPILMIFLSFAFVTIMELPSDLIIQAVEKPEYRLYAQIFAVYNLVSAIVLLKYFGIVGVALATGTAINFRSIYFFIMAKKIAQIEFPFKTVIKIFISSLVAFAIISIFTYLSNQLWVIALAIILSILCIHC